MRKLLACVPIAVLLLTGCGESSGYTSAPDGDVPDFKITDEQQSEQNGQTVVNVFATTEATSAEELRLIGQQVRSENADADGMFLSISAPGEEAGASGSVVAANSDEVAEVIFTPDILTSYMSEKTPEEIMREDGGMVVVSIEDTVDSMMEEVCAEETDPEMRTIMECPGA